MYIEKKQCNRNAVKSEKCYECGNAQMQIILTKGRIKFTAEDMGYKRQSLMAPDFSLFILQVRLEGRTTLLLKIQVFLGLCCAGSCHRFELSLGLLAY